MDIITEGGITVIDAQGLYERAITSGEGLSGYYNTNVRVDTDRGPVVVRIPITGADRMDLRIWPEHQVLQAVAPWVDAVPEILHVCDEPPFQIHRFINGDVVDAVAPRGVAVPDHLTGDVVRFFVQLTRVPVGALPSPPSGWPDSGRSDLFARRLTDVTQAVWDEFRGPFAQTYAALGFPNDPLAGVRHGGGVSSLTARPFAALHCDVHRKNLIVHHGRTWFLDWELALWGDPVYDLAVHLHKMGYHEREATALREEWLKAMPPAATGNAVEDVDVYLRHEHVKSAIVDTVRYAKQVRAEPSPRSAGQLAESLTTKLRWAARAWGSERQYDAEEVLATLRRA